jgi:hypothetical protein
MPNTLHDIPFHRPRELAEEIIAYDHALLA